MGEPKDSIGAGGTRRPKVVVITGASSGIGRAAAMAFAGRGDHVVLAAREFASLEPVVQQCREAGAKALAVPTDVRESAAMKALADAAVDQFGRIDVWINNVGVGVVGIFDETPIDAHRRVVESNLIGHMNGAHAALPHLRRQGHGTLINMISLGGWVPTPYAAAYSASKFGLRGFSEALRAELSVLPDVHVCEVYPTFVDSPGISHGANYTGRSIEPPPPLVSPSRVARLLVSLADRPRASVYIGAPSVPAIAAHAVAPNLLGRTLMTLMTRALDKAEAAPGTSGNLFEASRGTSIDGGFRSARLRKVAPVFAGLVGIAALFWLTRSDRQFPAN